MSTGQGASLNGFRPFSSDSLWNKDISASPVDPNSDAIINFIGSSVGMHADFGSGQYQGSNIGIPYSVVSGTQAPVSITFTAYGSESDPGPMPVPGNAPIEGDPNPGNGDRHVLVLDNSNCFLYELFSAVPNGNGSWNAASAAVWDLLSDGNTQRPWTWTSADAAGLPIFPGLVRYDEVAAGQIQHAIRVTLQDSRAAAVLPATHWAANSTSANAPPMGMRMRLKANYNISGFSTQVQVILSAMKKYGLIMADNGSSMYISGAPDSRWDNDALHDLGQVPASAFEVVKMDTVYTGSNVPQGAAPGINSFTATPSQRERGRQRDLVLGRQQCRLRYRLAAGGSGAGRERDRPARPDHHLQALRHQPVRPHHGDSHGNRAVGKCRRERPARAAARAERVRWPRRFDR